MSSIHIKNIGPLNNTGIVPLSTVLLIIGRQSSGKSTFMKILCFCRWLEKLIMISEEDIIPQYTHNLKFLNDLKAFHRMNDSFFSSKSEINYEGDTISILLKGNSSNVKITRKPDFIDKRYNTKLSFIPSERNLVSAIHNVDKVYRSSERDVLFNFLFEWDEAKSPYTSENPLHLSVSNNMEYVNDGGIDMIHSLENDLSFSPFFASSGIQSVMPIDVMADYFTSLVGKRANISKHDLTNKVLQILTKSVNRKQSVASEENTSEIEQQLLNLQNRIAYQSVQLFIEEPEQNLYPDSQKLLLVQLIKLIAKAKVKGKKDSILAMTTHSPYILSTLNVLLAESSAMRVVKGTDKEAKLKTLVKDEVLLPFKDISAYFIKKDGTLDNIIDKDLNMVSGVELDGVSDWVDEKIAIINSILYGE